MKSTGSAVWELAASVDLKLNFMPTSIAGLSSISVFRTPPLPRVNVKAPAVDLANARPVVVVMVPLFVHDAPVPARTTVPPVMVPLVATFNAPDPRLMNPVVPPAMGSRSIVSPEGTVSPPVKFIVGLGPVIANVIGIPAGSLNVLKVSEFVSDWST